MIQNLGDWMPVPACPKVVGQRCVACSLALHDVMMQNLGDWMSLYPKVAGQTELGEQ